MKQYWYANLSPIALGEAYPQDPSDSVFDYMLGRLKRHGIEIHNCSYRDVTLGRFIGPGVGVSEDSIALFGCLIDPDGWPTMFKGDRLFLDGMPRMIVVERRFFNEGEPVLMYEVALEL